MSESPNPSSPAGEDPNFDGVFENRIEAAKLLAERLDPYRGRNPLVLGIPRGAVPMAEVIANALEGELDVVLVRKLRAPQQPEYAIGSVSESGDVYVGDAVERLGIDSSYVDREVERQLETIRQRRRAYTPRREPISPVGRMAIVVDDGVATGWTMIAALRAVRAANPEKLVAAMAVAPPQAARRMEKEADELVCLATPESFYAVGQFFADFGEVTDEDVAAILG